MHYTDLWSLLVTVCNIYILEHKLFYDVLTVQCDDICGGNERMGVRVTIFSEL